MSKLSPEQVVDELNGCLQRLASSATAYILESNPYVSDRDKAATAAVSEIGAAERAQALECEGLILKRDGIPLTGLADAALAELNYLSYPRLLDFLEAELAKDLAHFQGALARLDSVADAKAFIESLVAARQEQIARIREIRQGNYKPAGAQA